MGFGTHFTQIELFDRDFTPKYSVNYFFFCWKKYSICTPILPKFPSIHTFIRVLPSILVDWNNKLEKKKIVLEVKGYVYDVYAPVTNSITDYRNISLDTIHTYNIFNLST